MDTFVHVSTVGGIGRIELDRPRALNALDSDMLGVIGAALDRWRDDDAVTAVLTTSRVGKAFCAGGDIRKVADGVTSDAGVEIDSYFRQEYEVDARIATYPKPYISVIDGVAMGGGLGISVHGSHRVISERAFLAMPETAIGFVPDIGATYFFNNLVSPTGAPLPELGVFAALTGYRLSAADALHVGLATHFVPSEAVAGLVAGIENDGLEAALAAFARPQEEAGASVLAKFERQIAEVFSAPTVIDIIHRLDNTPNSPEYAWASIARGALRALSPLAVTVTHRLLLANRGKSLQECLDAEREVGGRLTQQPDFVEGVRAVLVEKDKHPHWNPVSYGDIDAALVEQILGG